MANNVFANGREISCKKADGKSIAAFPDVCFTPPDKVPPTPPGVPIPYPNNAFAKDTTKGSKKVKISGKPIIKKNKSHFKTSVGNEPAKPTAKKGLVTSKVKGKAYFNAWSMDVKFEGKNVVRHMDLTTHNHGSVPGNTPTWPYLDSAAIGGDEDPCKDDKKKLQDNCSGNFEKDCKDDKCQEARKCMLVPHTPLKSEGQEGCCPGVTPDHMIEVHNFTKSGGRSGGKRLPGFEKYNDRRAPCVCAKGSRYSHDHGDQHAIRGMHERTCMDPDGPRSQMGGKDGQWTYKKAKEGALLAHKTTFESSGCDEGCIEAQLDSYHNQAGVTDDSELRADRSPLKARQKERGEVVMSGENGVII